MDLSRRLRELQEHEGDISKVRKELGSRLEEIQHRESMVSGIVEREKRLEERERAVGVKNADVLRRQGDVSGREKDVVAMRERFTSQMRDLEIRLGLTKLCPPGYSIKVYSASLKWGVWYVRFRTLVSFVTGLLTGLCTNLQNFTIRLRHILWNCYMLIPSDVTSNRRRDRPCQAISWKAFIYR